MLFPCAKEKRREDSDYGGEEGCFIFADGG